MSTNLDKPLNQTQQWPKLAPFNFWGPVRYPKKLSLQINHQVDWHEKFLVFLFIAFLLSTFGILAYVICRGRRRHRKLQRKEPVHCSHVRIDYGSKAITLVDGIMSMASSTNTTNVQANMETTRTAETHLKSSIIVTDENAKYNIEKHQPENLVTKVEPKDAKECFGINNEEGKSNGCKGTSTTFQDLTITMFEHQHDAVTSV